MARCTSWPTRLRPSRSCRRGSSRGYLARSERHEEAAVLVVRRKEVGGDVLVRAGPRPQRQLLAEAAHAPFAGDLRRLAVGEAQRVDDVPAHQLGFLEPGQLEDAAARCEHAALLVADDESGRRRRVVVVEQLEQEAEAAMAARGRL